MLALIKSLTPAAAESFFLLSLSASRSSVSAVQQIQGEKVAALSGRRNAQEVKTGGMLTEQSKDLEVPWICSSGDGSSHRETDDDAGILQGKNKTTGSHRPCSWQRQASKEQNGRKWKLSVCVCVWGG